MFVVSVRERGKEEHKFTFRKPEIVVGRLRSNDIILPKRNISKRHARMELTDDGAIMLVDNGSTNGCYINGKKIEGATPVGAEDKIFMGDYILQAQVLEEKSAIDEITGDTPLVGMDSPGQDRPTVADIDSSILDDELKRMEAEQSSGSAEALLEETGLEMDVVAEESGETVRFQDMVESTGGEVQFEIEDDEALVEGDAIDEAELTSDPLPADVVEEEDLIDIALEEEDDEVTVDPGEPFIEESAPVAAVEPSPAPAPAPAPAVAAGAFAPSATRLEQSLSTALEECYDDVAAAFDEWLEGGGDLDGAPAKVASLLTDALGDQVGGNVDELAQQVTGELTYIGAVASLLSQPQVGEVFVAPSGQIQATDWAGNAVDVDGTLSCPSANARIAERILEAAGDAGEGSAEARLQDNTLARVFQIPFAADIPALKFVRPFQTSMSLGKLKDTGVINGAQASALEGAIGRGDNVLVVGSDKATLSLLVHSLVGAMEPSQRLLVSGDRFVNGPGFENATPFAAGAVHSHDFAQACAQMGFDRLILDSGAGDTAAAAIELGILLQVPFVISARLADAKNVASLLGMAAAETRTAFLETLDAAGVVLASVSDGKVQSVARFALQGGQPTLNELS